MTGEDDRVVQIRGETSLIGLNKATDLSELMGRVPFRIIVPAPWPEELGKPEYFFVNRTQDPRARPIYCVASRSSQKRWLQVRGEEWRGGQVEQRNRRFARELIFDGIVAGTYVLMFCRGLSDARAEEVVRSLQPASHFST